MTTKLTVTTQLTGSEKQVAWAVRIRENLVESVNLIIEEAEKATGKTISEEVKAKLENIIASKTDAEWWIKKEVNGAIWPAEANKVIRGEF